MENYLTVAAAARVLAVSEKSIRRWITSGALRGTKIKRCVRVKESNLREFAEQDAE